jgi:hypothetical protein
MSEPTCLRCPNATEANHLHCPACEKELLAAGLCSRCGKEPRRPKWRQMPQSALCWTCHHWVKNYNTATPLKRECIDNQVKRKQRNRQTRMIRGMHHK